MCANHTWPSVSMGIDVFKKALQDIKRRRVKSRYIVEITKPYCNELVKIDELRHLQGIEGNLDISEKEYIASATLQQLIYCDLIAILEQHTYLFETLE